MLQDLDQLTARVELLVQLSERLVTDRDELNQQLEALRTQLSDTQNQLATKSEEHQSLTAQLAQAEQSALSEQQQIKADAERAAALYQQSKQNMQGPDIPFGAQP